MFSKEYPAGEYTFSADKMKNDTVQKMTILLTVEPLSYSVDSCAFNNYYKNYLIKNNKTLSRNITFKVDSPFEIGIPLSGDNGVVGETLSIKISSLSEELPPLPMSLIPAASPPPLLTGNSPSR